jgi:RHS repeat-associated protein
VYFDDITVKHYTGPLLQEQSYYPFGVEMAAISDKAMNKLSSAYKFNGGDEMEESISMYSTFYRGYDQQLGRFMGVDMASEQTSGMSVYQFGANNPIMFNDPLGDKLKDPSERLDLGPLGPYNPFAQAEAALAATNAETDAWFAIVNSGGGGGSGSGIDKNGNFYANGEAAKQLFWNLQDRYNHPDEDGNWSFDFGRNNKGQMGYWGPSDYNGLGNRVSADGLREVIVGTKFYSLNDASSQQNAGTIYMYRTWETDKSTISRFETGDGTIKGYMLEPAGPSTAEANQDRRIPAGVYFLTPHVNRRLHAEWELYNDVVPKSRYVLLHIGNFPSNTEACLLPGSSKGTDAVYGSGPMIDRLNNYINLYKGNVEIVICDCKN